MNKNGECSIMCRMSVRGERETFTTRVFTKPEDWEAKSQRILGRTARMQGRRMNVALCPGLHHSVVLHPGLICHHRQGGSLIISFTNR